MSKMKLRWDKEGNIIASEYLSDLVEKEHSGLKHGIFFPNTNIYSLQ